MNFEKSTKLAESTLDRGYHLLEVGGPDDLVDLVSDMNKKIASLFASRFSYEEGVKPQLVAVVRKELADRIRGRETMLSLVDTSSVSDPAFKFPFIKFTSPDSQWAQVDDPFPGQGRMAMSTHAQAFVEEGTLTFQFNDASRKTRGVPSFANMTIEEAVRLFTIDSMHSYRVILMKVTGVRIAKQLLFGNHLSEITLPLMQNRTEKKDIDLLNKRLTQLIRREQNDRTFEPERREVAAEIRRAIANNNIVNDLLRTDVRRALILYDRNEISPFTVDTIFSKGNTQAEGSIMSSRTVLESPYDQRVTLSCTYNNISCTFGLEVKIYKGAAPTFLDEALTSTGIQGSRPLGWQDSVRSFVITEDMKIHTKGKPWLTDRRVPIVNGYDLLKAHPSMRPITKGEDESGDFAHIATLFRTRLRQAGGAQIYYGGEYDFMDVFPVAGVVEVPLGDLNDEEVQKQDALLGHAAHSDVRIYQGWEQVPSDLVGVLMAVGGDHLRKRTSRTLMPSAPASDALTFIKRAAKDGVVTLSANGTEFTSSVSRSADGLYVSVIDSSSPQVVTVCFGTDGARTVGGTLTPYAAFCGTADWTFTELTFIFANARRALRENKEQVQINTALNPMGLGQMIPLNVRQYMLRLMGSIPRQARYDAEGRVTMVDECYYLFCLWVMVRVRVKGTLPLVVEEWLPFVNHPLNEMSPADVHRMMYTCARNFMQESYRSKISLMQIDLTKWLSEILAKA